MLIVVLDTNIIISAAISANGNPAKIVDAVLDKNIQAYYSSEIMAEYEEVLSRKEFNFDPLKKDEFISGLKTNGILIKPFIGSEPFIDEDDRIFYDAAKEIGALLITGNKKHYPNESFIMTPAEFIKLYYVN